MLVGAVIDGRKCVKNQAWEDQAAGGGEAALLLHDSTLLQPLLRTVPLGGSQDKQDSRGPGRVDFASSSMARHMHLHQWLGMTAADAAEARPLDLVYAIKRFFCNPFLFSAHLLLFLPLSLPIPCSPYPSLPTLSLPPP